MSECRSIKFDFRTITYTRIYGKLSLCISEKFVSKNTRMQVFIVSILDRNHIEKIYDVHHAVTVSRFFLFACQIR